MPDDETAAWKVWAGVILFFGIGVLIALAVASAQLGRGSHFGVAIAMGAFAGGYGAWFVFFVVFNVARWIRQPRR